MHAESVARAAALVEQRAGLKLGAAQERRLAALLEEAASARGTAVPAYVDALAAGAATPARGGRAALDALIDGLVVHETGFFRHRAQVAALRDRAIPELCREAAARGAPVRVWSAGCATGEEAWTLALLLAEQGAYGASGAGAEILATDISAPALERAAAGRYHAEDLEDVPAELRARWFVEDGDRMAVAPALRERVRFERLNLAADLYPGAVDLVLCRNVLIYFAPEARERALGELYRSLRPGGWIVVGYSESLRGRADLFETIEVGEAALFRRTSRPALRARGATLPSQSEVERGSPTPAPTPSVLAAAAAVAGPPLRARQRADDTLPRGIQLPPVGAPPPGVAGPRRIAAPTGDALGLRRAIASAITEGLGRVEVDLDAATYLTADDAAALAAAARMADERDVVLRLCATRAAARAFVTRIGLGQLLDPREEGR
jgi:chemotaxis protein methyltransferase CheR